MATTGTYAAHCHLAIHHGYAGTSLGRAFAHFTGKSVEGCHRVVCVLLSGTLQSHVQHVVAVDRLQGHIAVEIAKRTMDLRSSMILLAIRLTMLKSRLHT